MKSECGVLEKELLCRCRRTGQERSSLHHEAAGRSALPGTGDGQERVEACKEGKLQNGRDRFRSKRRWK
jgi:hypothetical protein